MKKIAIWFAIIIIVLVAVSQNPSYLDFIKHIRSKNLNLKFPLTKGETQDYTTLLDLKIFSVYSFRKIEHTDSLSHDSDFVYIKTYNGKFKEFSGVYLGLFKKFVLLKSKEVANASIR